MANDLYNEHPYNGFHLTAGGVGLLNDKGQVVGYKPTLSIAKHDDAYNVTLDHLFDVPHPDGGFTTLDGAVLAAIDYGHAVVDGNVPGVTVGDQ